MSERELRALGVERGNTSPKVKLRSGNTYTMTSEASLSAETGEVEQQLQKTRAELENKEKDLLKARGDITRLQNDIRMVSMELEIDKFKQLETLRKDFDKERRQLRDQREMELAFFKEWKEEMLAENAILKRQLEQSEKVLAENVSLKRQLEHYRRRSFQKSSRQHTSESSNSSNMGKNIMK